MNDFIVPVDPDEADSAGSEVLHKEVDPIFDSIANEVDSNIEPVTTTEDTTTEVEEVNPDDTTQESSQQEQSEQDTSSIPTSSVLPENTNYEDFYKEMMSPIKANGKTLFLQSAKEARQLIQMGANYTKKMQDLAPKRKIIEYLRLNGFESENDVNYLVDLANGNKTAIQKWIQDKNIDLNSIDPPEYDDDGKPKPINYIPSSSLPDDQFVATTTIMRDIQQTKEGKAFIDSIIDSWDNPSKDFIYNHPEVLYDLSSQKQNGIFDVISSEVDRRKTVGSIPESMDFITAYSKVGEDLNRQGKLIIVNNNNNNSIITPNESISNSNIDNNNNVVTKPYIQHGNTTMQTNNTNTNNTNAAQVKSAGLTRMSNSTTKPVTKNTAIQNLYKQSAEGALSGDDFIQQFNKLFKIND